MRRVHEHWITLRSNLTKLLRGQPHHMSRTTTYFGHNHHNPCSITNNPSRSNVSKSPPASRTAFFAASLNFLRFSAASFSRLAFVLLLPLGATPVRIFLLSSGVKLTKPMDAERGPSWDVPFSALDFRRAWCEDLDRLWWCERIGAGHGDAEFRRAARVL